MARFGFVGASYQSESPNVDAELLVNWYVEGPESPGARTALAMYPCPGKTIFCTLAGPSVRGEFFFQGVLYAVSGASFYSINAAGTPTLLGTVASDNAAVSFTAGPNQILFASAGSLYVWTISTATLTLIPTSTLFMPNVSQVAYLDGFFIALFTNSNAFQESATGDATTWPLINVGEVSVFGDNVVGMVTAYRQIIFFGSKQSVAYYDAGTPLVAISPVSGGFIEQGSVATYASAFMDNSVFWIGADSRGSGIAWRANGYTPDRVSTFAVEYAWSKYSTIADAISFTYQEAGHTFWEIYFPTANATWVYDAASQQWHQRGVAVGEGFSADHARCYAFAYGLHLVGDWASGNIYVQSIQTLTDNGNQIRRVRRAPTIGTELEYTFHHQLEVDMEVGLGPIPPLLDGRGNPREPQVILRWSDDGGHTWSNEYSMGCGMGGNYSKRVIWRRLGRSRQRIYELSCSDPVPYRIVDAYLKASPSYDTTERIAAQVRKVS